MGLSRKGQRCDIFQDVPADVPIIPKCHGGPVLAFFRGPGIVASSPGMECHDGQTFALASPGAAG